MMSAGSTGARMPPRESSPTSSPSGGLPTPSSTCKESSPVLHALYRAWLYCTIPYCTALHSRATPLLKHNVIGKIFCQKIFDYSFSFQATDMVFTAKWDRILIFCFVVSWMMNRLEEAFDFNLWCVYHPWTLDVHCNCSGGSSRLCNKLIMLVWKMIFRVLWRSGQIRVKTGWLGEVCTLHIPYTHCSQSQRSGMLA